MDRFVPDAPLGTHTNGDVKMKVKAPYFWMWLCKTHGIGPKKLASIAKILHEHQRQPETLPLNPTELLSQFPRLANILNGKIRVEDSQAIYTEYLRLKDAGITMLHPSDPNFPRHLLEISPILFIKGQHKLLTSDSVAIVGSRDVSDEGVRVARTIAGGLAREGINVVSGYAKGVDSEAHSAALASGGTTTLVLPHGITGLRQKKRIHEFQLGAQCARRVAICARFQVAGTPRDDAEQIDLCAIESSCRD